MNEDEIELGWASSLPVEDALLGGVFFIAEVAGDLGPRQKEYLAEAQQWLRPEDFPEERQRIYWEVMLDLASRHISIDAHTMRAELEARGRWEACGGAARIAHLVAHTSQAVSVTQWAKAIHLRALRRQLRIVAQDIAERAKTAVPSLGVRDLLAEAESELLVVTRDNLGEDDQSFANAMEAEVARIKRGELAGVPTGFTRLDHRLAAGGFSRGSLNVIAASTSVGKTALATNIAARITRGGTLFISVEMTREEMIRRLLAVAGEVNFMSIMIRRPAVPHGDESSRLDEAVAHYEAMPLNVVHRPHLTPLEVQRLMRRALQDFDGRLDLVVIDYLQLMDPDGEHARRDLEIGSITKDLKNLAAEFNVPVLLLSQLNREAAHTDEPELHHLRESGAIEQDADVVIFLWLDKEGAINWKIAKQRNGIRTYLPPLQFDAQYTKFNE